MDLLTHILSGTAAGTVAASFSKDTKNKILIIASASAGGALPDIDAISLWSKFDATVGAFFNLGSSGKVIYSAKFWYSHHAFMHSLFAGTVIAAGLFTAAVLIKNKFKDISLKSLKSNFRKYKLLIIGFLSGYFLHLFGDIPTPSSTWGGIRLFFPFHVYVGGTGHIWWWNNYDIFLAVCTVIFINILLLLSGKYLGRKLKYLTIAVFAAGICFCMYQIGTRGFDFSYSGYTKKYQEYEYKSKEIQKDVLGEKVCKIMEKIDRKLPVYF